MNDLVKLSQLRKHKMFATGLFIAMLIVYIGVTWIARSNSAAWTGYVRAFSEAAMVGALADWFAVTALFNHPLGIPIPHTNLIENSKKSIGDNLGNFVVSNFLTPANIRPYINKVAVSSYVAGWLEKEKNKQLLVQEIGRLLKDIVVKMDSITISGFIARKAGDLLNDLKLNVIVGNALGYFLDKNEHQQLVTLLAGKLKTYIIQNEELVKEKVKAESYFFIPKFVDNKLASKITSGLAGYFEEIEQDKEHRIRAEVSSQLYSFTEQLRSDAKWEEEFRGLKNNLLPAEKLEEYAGAIWNSLKTTILEELGAADSLLLRYFSTTIDELARNLKEDEQMRNKIDGWIRYNAYKYILKNTRSAGELISNTVGNWEGRELSRKLELEVGKDLQFIRINGTIVGGLVGLLIHTFTELFK